MSSYIESLLKEPYSGAKTSIVIGIDIGTTYSGVSYAVLRPGQPTIVQPINKFPDQERGDFKVPSIIYYASDERGYPKAVAATAANETIIRKKRMREKWFKSEHFKLHLGPHDQTRETNGMVFGRLPRHLSNVQVMGDFLRYLVEETWKILEDKGFEALRDEAIYVIAHPNEWRGAPQGLYRTSAIIGGLIPDTNEGHKRIKFVTEGEASALACLRGKLDHGRLGRGFRFVVCDAGGGTVDTTMYEVIGTSPLQLKECSISSTRYVGGELVTLEGRKLLKEKLANSVHDNEAKIDKLSKEFDSSVKRHFAGDSDMYLDMDHDELNDEKLGIDAGSLTLIRDKIASCFEVSVSQIVDSIHDQFSRSNSDETNTPVWLTGGFANSRYLQNEVRTRLQHFGISVEVSPDESLAKAVANGSVLHYIGKVVVARVSRATYGTECHTEYDEENPRHCERRRRSGDDGPFIGPIFRPIVKKGDLIPEDERFSCSFHKIAISKETAQFEAKILCYEGDTGVDPVWYDEDNADFRMSGRIKADLSSLCDSMQRRRTSLFELFLDSIFPKFLEFEIELELGGTEDKARIKWEEDGTVKYGPAILIHEE